MFIFGHVGIGGQLVKWITRPVSILAVYFGTLVPDLIDKTLYYGLSWSTGLRGSDLGLISGTRTFGHTLLLTLSVLVLARVFKSAWILAVFFGMASHILLDVTSDLFRPQLPPGSGGGPSPYLWPFQGGGFPVQPFLNVGEHLHSFGDPLMIITEVLGFFLIIRHFVSHRRYSGQNQG